MKKIFLFCIYFYISFPLWSQIEQGKVLLGGGIQYQKVGDYDQFSGSIGAAYLFSSNAAFGLSIGRSQEQLIDLSVPIVGEVTTLAIRAYTRNYFPIADKFYFFLQSSVGYLKAKLDDEFSGDEIEDEGIIVGLSPGFSFYPSKMIGIEFSMNGLAYQFADSDSEEGIFILDINPFSPSIGISFLLGKSVDDEK